MFRVWCLCALTACVVFGQNDVPFEDWLKGKDDARIRWQLHVFPAQLSENQRLETTVRAGVDADEFMRRGPLVVYLQIRDRENRSYRSFTSLTPGKDVNMAEVASLNWDQHACVLPGDYDVAAAVYDTRSKEHSLKRAKLHVPELPHDPLANAWRDLPEVDFSDCVPIDSPQLFLPLKTERPVHVDLVMNQSTNRNETGSNRSADRLMQTLASRLLVLSEMQLVEGSMNVTLLDVERRKATFTEAIKSPESIKRLWEELTSDKRLTIDLHSLENYKENAQFFVSEIRKRVETPGPHAVIVLSAPLAFPKGEDLQRIEAAPSPGSQVFYIRCNAPVYGTPDAIEQAPTRGFSGARGRGRMIRHASQPDNFDSLEGTLKPLNPRLFDVTTAVEFRSALAAIMGGISHQN